jgi:hypothetical protein
MDVTADNLINQVAQAFFSKINQQELDPRFIENFFKQLQDKVTARITTSNSSQNSNQNSTAYIDQIKKTYIEVLKDSRIVKEAQNFLKKILDKQVISNLFNNQAVPRVTSDKNTETSIKGLEKLKDIKITGLEKLKDIKIIGIEKLKDVKILGLEKLKDLKIAGTEKLKNLSINSIDKLKDIKLTDINKLRDISIKGIEKLRDISIKGIERLKDFSIKGIEKIRDISINGIEKIRDISISNIDKLRDVKILGTEKLKENLSVNQPAERSEDGNRPSLIKEDEKPKKVIIVGFGENAMKFLKEGLGGSLKKLFDNLTKSLKDLFPKQGTGLGLLGGGLLLLLGGLAALVAGLMTDGPFKGLLKILSKIGLSGAMKMLEAGAKLFIGNLKLVFELIGNTFKDAAKFIGRLFGRNVYKTLLQIGKNISTTVTSLLTNLTESVTGVFKRVRGFFTSIFDNILTFATNIGDNILKSVTETFSKVAGKSVIGRVIGNVASMFATLGSKLFKILRPILGRIPGIGTIISWGFAYTRFKSGDTIGGIIDVLSGIATLFPGIGTAIGIGLDVLNAFLDYKTGGATAEASVKKGNIIKGWLDNAWNYWKEKILNIPLIKNIIETGEAFAKGDWALALTKFIRIIPNAGWILDWMGMTEDKSVETLNQSFDALTSFWTWVKESIFGKIGSMISGVIDWGKEKLSGIMSAVSNLPGLGWLAEPEPSKIKPSTNKQLNQTSTSTDIQPEKKLAAGGIVTKPTTALMGEAGPEAVIPLEKYFSKSDFTLNNSTLESIASNTKDTNTSLQSLSQALYKLVVVLDKKVGQTSPTTLIGLGNNQQKNTPSASVIANNNFDPIRAVRAQFA